MHYIALCKINYISGRGVTANILVLGTSDSGFESQRPDHIKKLLERVVF